MGIKICLCCNSTHRISTISETCEYIGYSEFNGTIYGYFNCSCGSTLVVRVVNTK